MKNDKISKNALNRIEKSKINTMVTLITSIVMAVFSFIERTIFNQFFIADYLGLYSFNYSLINTLSNIELGLSASVAFALYKPLQYHDEDKIAAIMQFYKKAYLTIGSILLLLGISVTPFLQYLTKTEIPINQIRLYFLIFLMGTVTSYWIGYSTIIFNANQEKYVVSLITNTAWTILYIVEIIISVKTHNFLLYSLSIFTAYLLKNIVIWIASRKKFKFLRIRQKKKLDSETLKGIKKNTIGTISNRIGGAVVNITDSILISAMVGTTILGFYTNYTMLYSGLITIAALLPQNITDSLGNAGVTETKRKLVKGFYAVDLGSFLIYSIIAVLFFNIATPIVKTFFGASRSLPNSTIILMTFNFYLACSRETILSYKSGMGLYWEDRIRPLFEALVNLVVSVILGYYMGLNGIIIGTICSLLLVDLIIEPVIVFHKGFGHSVVWYIISSILRLVLFIFIGAISFILCSLCNIQNFFINQNFVIGKLTIDLGSFLQIIINSVISLIITISFSWIFFRKTEAMKKIIETIKIAFLSKKKRNELREKTIDQIAEKEFANPPDMDTPFTDEP